MNYLLILTIFFVVAFASITPPSPFEEFAPKNEKALKEYKTTATIVQNKSAEIEACKSELDLASFKVCLSKITDLPQDFIDSFTDANYNDENCIENAMKALSADLTKKLEKVVSDEDLAFRKKKEANATYYVFLYYSLIVFYIISFAFGALLIIGFCFIIYFYYFKKPNTAMFEPNMS